MLKLVAGKRPCLKGSRGRGDGSRGRAAATATARQRQRQRQRQQQPDLVGRLGHPCHATPPYQLMPQRPSFLPSSVPQSPAQPPHYAGFPGPVHASPSWCLLSQPCLPCLQGLGYPCCARSVFGPLLCALCCAPPLTRHVEDGRPQYYATQLKLPQPPRHAAVVWDTWGGGGPEAQWQGPFRSSSAGEG